MKYISAVMFFPAFLLATMIVWLTPCLASAVATSSMAPATLNLDETSLAIQNERNQDHASFSSLLHLLHHHYLNFVTTDGSDPSQRKLAFSALNTIFSQITLKLPDTQVSRSGLDITITELTCNQLKIQDIQLSHALVSDTLQRLEIDISGLEIICNFRWEYKWTIFNGSGNGSAKLDPSSSASIGLDVLSQNYNNFPPNDVNVNQCQSNIQIADMDFDGDGLGVIGGIMSLIEGLLRDTVEGELGGAVCNDLIHSGQFSYDYFPSAFCFHCKTKFTAL